MRASGETFGAYRLGRKLGEGQMGEVFEAAGPQGQAVALKILRIGAFDTHVRARFLREARVCSALRHPNVITVSDHGIHHDEPYLVMPILRGADLERWLERTGPLAPDVAIALVLQACAGVLAAHEAGIVHRDLKPANVFLDVAENGKVRVVICDFGVAKIVDEDGAMTASGSVLGTPLFMAPEQLLDSKRVDSRCDVWALGMILYHALAGAPAFGHLSSIADLVVALNDNAVPAIQERAPWITPALARLVHAALLPVDQRIASVRRFEDMLHQLAIAAPELKVASLVPLPADRRSVTATRATLPTSAAELVDVFEATAAGDGVEPPERADERLGRTLEERYRIVAMIGRGGMGAVYEAIDLNATRDEERVVALKIMHAEPGVRGIEAIRRFLREAKAAARIKSPHVTRFIDSGVDRVSGGPFIVMERLRGADLASRLLAAGALAPEPAVRLFGQACEALAAAHALGIVHRDIKPSNLFLHRDGAAIVLKVCDFGIAKQLAREGSEASTELTRSGGLIGSPLYMSPEQAKGSKNVDERSDVFSLALTLHETLSGTRPWPGRTSMGEIIVAVCTEDVPPLLSLAPWVPPELSAVLSRALARAPADRYASIREFAAALAPFGAAAGAREEDLVGVASHRRGGPPVAPTEEPKPRTETTGQPFSVTAGTPPARKRRSGLIVAAAAAALLVPAGFAALKLSQVSTRVVGSSNVPRAAAPDSAPAITLTARPDAATAATPSATASGTPAVTVSASAVAPPLVARPRRIPSSADAGVKVAAPSTVPAATAPSSSGVGRAFTATDLPPAK